jgi:hypothetical protein
MKKVSKFISTFFIPFTLILAALMASSKLSRMIGQHMRAHINCHEAISMSTRHMIELGIIALFIIVIYLVRHLDFKIIFKGSLAFVGALLAFCVLIFGASHLACFSCCVVSTRILALMGWAYLNQHISLKSSSSYYFGINVAYSLLMIPVVTIPTYANTKDPHFTKIILLVALVLFLFALLCDKWISQKLLEKTSSENTSLSSFRWVSLLGLGVLAFGLNGVAILLSPAFKEAARLKTESPSDFSVFLGSNAMTVGLIALLVAVIMIVVGPWLLKHKGWKFSVYLLLVLSALSTLPLFFTDNSAVHFVNQIVLASAEFAILIPLLQIAFTSYEFKERFMMQACVFLVLAPLFTLGVRQFQTPAIVNIVAALIILAFMAGFTHFIAKKNKHLC